MLPRWVLNVYNLLIFKWVGIHYNEKGYDTEMREEGVTDIIKFGIAFSGENVKIRTE